MFRLVIHGYLQLQGVPLYYTYQQAGRLAGLAYQRVLVFWRKCFVAHNPPTDATNRLLQQPVVADKRDGRDLDVRAL
jgi:hypothetical protein